MAECICMCVEEWTNFIYDVNCVVVALWCKWKNPSQNLYENWLLSCCRKFSKYFVELCKYGNEIVKVQIMIVVNEIERQKCIMNIYVEG